MHKSTNSIPFKNLNMKVRCGGDTVQKKMVSPIYTFLRIELSLGCPLAANVGCAMTTTIIVLVFFVGIDCCSGGGLGTHTGY